MFSLLPLNTADRLVLLVGDLSVDVMFTVPSLPHADQKVNGERLVETPGGMSAIVAVGLSRLGTRVRLKSAVGDGLLSRKALVADAFAAAFLHMYLRNSNLAYVLGFANAAATFSRTGYGAQTRLPTTSKVEEFLRLSPATLEETHSCKI